MTEDKIEEEYPIRKLFAQNANRLFSNKNIFVMILFMILALLMVFFSLSFAAEFTVNNQREFSVTTIEGQEYAIIYNNGNTYYLEEITTTEDSISIDTTKQRVIISDDISYKIIEYANVFKLPPDD